MPNFTTNLSITTGRGDTLSASKTGDYNEVFNIRQSVHNSDQPTLLLSGAKTVGVASINNSQGLVIKNTGLVQAEIVIETVTHTNGTPDTTSSVAFQKYILRSNDFLYFPNIRQMYSSQNFSSINAYTLDNVPPHASMYAAVNNAAVSDPQLVNEAIDSSETEIDVDEGAYFYVGDLIRIEDEIMKVTSISSNTLTVIRGTHGSTATSHSDDTAIRFPFFNTHVDFDKYSTAQTDASGNFMAMNFFVYGRNTDGSGNRESNGVNNIAIKFYSSGYQELGLSNISSNTSSNLAVSQ